MKQNTDWEHRVDEALNSLDGIQRAVANPFLYTRIQAKLEERRNKWTNLVNFISRPAVAISATAIFITVNAMVALGHPTQANVAISAAADNEMGFEPDYATVNYSLMDVNADK